MTPRAYGQGGGTSNQPIGNSQGPDMCASWRAENQNPKCGHAEFLIKKELQNQIGKGDRYGYVLIVYLRPIALKTIVCLTNQRSVCFVAFLVGVTALQH